MRLPPLPERRPLSSRLWVISLTEELARRIEKSVSGWPPLDREHLGDQWVRAIDSIGLNVSEGYVRIHKQERLHFYSYASASIDEAGYCVRRARDRGLITRLDAWAYFEMLVRLGKGITALAATTK